MKNRYLSQQPMKKGDKALDRFIERLSQSNSRSLFLNSSADARQKDRLDIKSLHLSEIPVGEMLLSKFTTQSNFEHEVHLMLPDELVAQKRDLLIKQGIKDKKQLAAEVDAYRAAKEQDLAVLRSRLDAFVGNANNFKKDKGIDPIWLGYPILHIPHSKKTFRFASSDSSDERGILAPVFLWPVMITRDPQQRFTWTISVNAAEGRSVKANTALFEWVKANKSVDIPELDAAKTENGGITAGTIQAYLAVIEKSLSLPKGTLNLPASLGSAPSSKEQSDPTCKVYNSALLGMYVHQKESILRDLKEINKKPQIPSKILNAMLDGTHGAPRLAPSSSSKKLPCLSDITALDCDYSQKAAAILGSTEGNLIIHGAPGTGKSQVITEIIVQALHQGKRVLVCCEKKAALEVIKKRLGKLNLDTFCALMQDTQKDRKTILTGLRDLQQHNGGHSQSIDHRTTLARHKAEIKRQAGKILDANRLLFSETSFGLVWNRLIAFNSRHSRKLSAHSKDAIQSFDPKIDSVDALHEVTDEVKDTYVLWKAAEIPTNPLRNVLNYSLSSYSNDTGTKIAASADKLSEAFTALKGIVNSTNIDRNLTHSILTQPPERLALVGVLGELNTTLCSGDARQIPAIVVGAILKNKPWEFGAAQIPELYARLERHLTNPLYEHFNDLPSRLELEEALADSEVLAKIKGSFVASVRRAFRFKSVHRLRRFKKRHFLPRSISLAHKNTRDIVEAALSYISLCSTIREFFQVTDARIETNLTPSIENWFTVTALARSITSFFSGFPDISAVFGRGFNVTPNDRLFLQACHHSFENDTPSFYEIHTLYLHCMRLHATLNDMKLHLKQEHSEELASFLLQRLALNGDLDGMGEYKVKSIAKHSAQVKNLLRYEDRMNKISDPARHIVEALETWEDAKNEDDWEYALGYAASRKHVEHSLHQSPDLHHITASAFSDWQMRLNKSIERARTALQDATVHTWIDVRSKKASETTTGELHRLFPLREKSKKSLREIVEANLDLALSVYPVWMGNPEALCATLPLQPDLFDIVIFDEASQCLTEDAIPVIYRGKSIVVSGDDKQLPPTSFFKSASGENDDEVLDEADDDETRQAMHEQELLQDRDLLQTARKMHLGESPLLLHYRSMASDLIEFSNHAFYGKRLRFVPNSRAGSESSVELIQVNGVYEKKTNLDEVMQIIELLKSFKQDEELSQKSVGVVTLNMFQRDLLSEKLNEGRQADPEFSAYIDQIGNLFDDGEDRSFFIKNLEEVQGDERDIIIVSTTFGQDRDGTFRRNFGPIIKQGGERRLNVLVTRAKSKMIVVTSIPEEHYSQDLDIINAQSRERAIFYAYLKYARSVSLGLTKEKESVLKWLSGLSSTSGTSTIGPKNTEETYLTESPLESEIFESLEARFPGRIATQVWQGSFRIDLAVRSRTNPNQYILGVEADGYAFHSDPLKVEEDRTRQRVLEGLGWRIERVMSTDWWDNYKRETLRLCNVIEALDAVSQS